MGALFGDGTSNFVITVSTVFLLSRLSVAAQLLSGLHCFKVQQAEPPSKDAAAQHRNRKQERKLAKLGKGQAVQIEGAENMVRIRLPRGAFERSDFFEDFEYLVHVCCILALNFAIVATPLSSMKQATAVWPLMIAACLPFLTALFLARVELLAETTSRRDKLYVLGLWVLSTGLAGAALELSPHTVLDFRWEAAAQELSALVTQVARRVHSAPQDVPDVALPAAVLRGALTLLAGLLGALLANGAVRQARTMALAVTPPHATRQYLTLGSFPVAAMRLATAAPVLGVLLWVKPISQTVLGWPEAQTRSLQAGIVMLMAAVQALSIRPLLQGYLNSGLLSWWTHTHAVTQADASRNPKIGELIRMKADFVNVLCCKVAVEFMAPAAIWGACGSLLAFSAWMNYTAGTSSLPWPLHLWGSGTAQRWPTGLLTSAAGFLAWWTSACWVLFTLIVLFLHKLGMINT